MANGITASGKMSVGRFEKEFMKEFGVRIEVKVGNCLADNSASLASLRPKKYKGPKSADFNVSGNMLIGNVKNKIKETFGVTVDLYHGGRIAPNDITLSALRLGNVKKENDSETKEIIDSPITDSSLNDEQIIEFKEQEAEAEYSSDFMYLAEELIEAGDKDWAKKLYKKAEEKAEYSSDYVSLADSILNENYLNDLDWGIIQYKNAERIAESSDDAREIAESIYNSEKINDDNWIKSIYDKVEDLALSPNDFGDLISSLNRCDFLNDNEWGKTKLKNCEAKIFVIENIDDCLLINDYHSIISFISAISDMKDIGWLNSKYIYIMDTFRDIIENMKNQIDYSSLIRSINSIYQNFLIINANFDFNISNQQINENWIEYLQKIEKIINSSAEYFVLGEAVLEKWRPFIESDPDWIINFSTNCFNNAINVSNDIEELITAVDYKLNEEYYSNDELIAKAGEKALSIANSFNDFVSIAFKNYSGKFDNEDVFNEAIENAIDLKDTVTDDKVDEFIELLEEYEEFETIELLN